MKNARMNGSRRAFLGAGLFAMTAPLWAARRVPAETADGPVGVSTPLDAERMRALIAFTMKTMDTPHPVPYGAEIFDTKTGVSLMRAVNRVGETMTRAGMARL